MNDAETAVYLMKDAAGEMIYVGCSRSPMSRFYQHDSVRDWFKTVANIQVKWYAQRHVALAAEARFIRRFRPRHNVMHNPDHGFARVFRKQKPTLEPTVVGGFVWDNEDGGVNICITADDLEGDVIVIGDFFVTDSLDRLLHMAKIPFSRVATHAGYEIDDDLKAKLLDLGCEICPEISKEGS